MACLKNGQRCVLVLANDVLAEAGFAQLIHFVLGDTDVPYEWEYRKYAGKS